MALEKKEMYGRLVEANAIVNYLVIYAQILQNLCKEMKYYE